jgi:hypothetical protein
MQCFCSQFKKFRCAEKEIPKFSLCGCIVLKAPPPSWGGGHFVFGSLGVGVISISKKIMGVWHFDLGFFVFFLRYFQKTHPFARKFCKGLLIWLKFCQGLNFFLARA